MRCIPLNNMIVKEVENTKTTITTTTSCNERGGRLKAINLTSDKSIHNFLQYINNSTDENELIGNNIRVCVCACILFCIFHIECII